MSKRRMTTVVGLMLSTAMLVSACSSKTTDTKTNPTPAPAAPDASKPVDGGALVVGQFSDIKNLNPLYIEDTASSDLAYFLFASVYDYNRNFDLEVNDRTIGAALPETSADGLTYTMKIKNNVKWSDGSPVTVDDIIFTYKAYMDPKAGNPGASGFESVKEIKKIDETTYSITLKDVDASFRYNLAIAPVPAKVFKDVKPEDYKAVAYGKDPKVTLTSGPYTWKEWKEKQYNVLERDPKYWGKKANIQTITIKQYADQNTEIQALAAGEIDFVSAVPIPSLPAVEGKPGLKTFEGLGQSYDYLMFNFQDKSFPGGKSPFAGAKTRMAIGHAINKKEMVQSVTAGHGALQNGPFLATSWANDSSVSKGYEFDVAKAKALLAEDGWKPGADGILAKDGQKFEFEIITNSGNKRRESYMAIIQQNLKDVGINVTLKPVDFQAIGDIQKKGEFQAILLGWSLNSPDPDKQGLFSQAALPPNGQNYGFYNNPALDKLWIDGLRTTDQAKRKAVYKDVLAQMQANPPYIFISALNTLGAYKGDKVHWADADKPETSVPTGYYFHMADWWVSK